MANVACFDQPAVVPTDDFPSEDVALGSSPGAGLGNGQLHSANRLLWIRSHCSDLCFEGAKGCLSAPVCKPETGLAGICTGLRERMDPWCVREAQDQMRRMSESPVSAGNDQVIRQHLSRSRRIRTRVRNRRLSPVAGRDLLSAGGGPRW